MSVKIIVLADTHVPERAADIPGKIYEEIKSADILLHAGDIAVKDFFKKLEKTAKTYAVRGNMDEPELKMILPQKQIIEINNIKIGLIHGWGSPFGLLEIVEKEFIKDSPDLVVFGHSHKAFNMERNGVIYFNPGSPTDEIFSDKRSYGIITINKKAEAEIINL